MFGQEHIKIGIKNLLGNQLKVLILNATLIRPFLPHKRYPQRWFQIAFDLAEFLHGIIEYVMSVHFDV